MMRTFVPLALLALALGGCATTTLPSVQAASAPDDVVKPAIAPVATARVVMLRLYVADLDRSTAFYHAVFDTMPAQNIGDHARVLLLPGGSFPGIILIAGPDEATMNGSFLMQVADVQGTLAKAAAQGGTLMNTAYDEAVAGMQAQSSHFIDPDGNIIEVMQIGG